jgi:quinol monooxygenase YgiN
MRKPMLALARACFAGAVFTAVAPVASAADGAVVVVVRFYPTPGKEEELEARLLRSAAFVRKAEPNFTYRLHRSLKEPAVFVLYEFYPSQSDFDNHVKVTLPASSREFGPIPDGLLARPFEAERFRPISE